MPESSRWKRLARWTTRRRFASIMRSLAAMSPRSIRRASSSSSAWVRRRVLAMRWRNRPRASPSSRPSWDGAAVVMSLSIRQPPQGILRCRYAPDKGRLRLLERLRLRAADRAIGGRPVALRHRAVWAVAADGKGAFDRGREDDPPTIGRKSQIGVPEPARRRCREHQHRGRDARGKPCGEHAARPADGRGARRRVGQRLAEALEIGWERRCHFNSMMAARARGCHGPAHSGRAASHSTYLSDVHAMSHSPKLSVATPLTLAERISGFLSHTYGIAGACSLIILSMLAQAVARSSGLARISALSIASLMAGSFSSDQLELFAGMMFLPLNVGSSSV